MLTKRTPPSWNAVREAVVKSLVPGADADDHVGLAGQRVGGRGPGRADGTHLLRVAVRQRALAGLRLPDRDAGGLAERPQRVLGTRVVHAAARDDHRPLCAERMTSAAAATRAASAGGRATCQVRSAKSSTGQSYASACTSCGRATVTAPVSAGSVSTRIALSRADGSCSGRLTAVEVPRQRAERVVDGDVAGVRQSRAPAAPAPSARVAKVPDGSSSTGSRLIVASAAPVSMLVEPGPTDAVQTQVCSRSFWRA